MKPHALTLAGIVAVVGGLATLAAVTSPLWFVVDNHWALGGSKLHLLGFYATEIWVETDAVRIEGTRAAWVALAQIVFGTTLLAIRGGSRLRLLRGEPAWT